MLRHVTSSYVRYQYTPDTARTALQRHPALVSELEELGGDILCLQEVGLDYEPHLSAELRSRGYTGAFHPKTMGTMEGCATYWRTGQFEADLSAMLGSCYLLQLPLDNSQSEKDTATVYRKLNVVAAFEPWQTSLTGGWRWWRWCG